MLYNPSHETENNEEIEKNYDPKDGDGSKWEKKNMSASSESIKNLLDVEKQDIANAKYFEYEFLNSGRINKI